MIRLHKVIGQEEKLRICFNLLEAIKANIHFFEERFYGE